MTKAKHEIRAERARHTAQKALRPISPYAKGPKTVFLRDERGNPMAVVAPQVLTPKRAKWADALGGLTAWAGSALAVTIVANSAQPHPLLWPAAVFVPFFFVALYRRGWRRVLRKSIPVIFTTERFIVKNAEGGGYVYDRQEPHKFFWDGEHEAARKEAEENGLAEMRARMRGQVIAKPKYQSETFHLYLNYRGYPYFVMEIMGREAARDVLARLNQVDAEMDEAVAMGAMAGSGPQSEWDDMAGKIPEKV